MEQSSIIKAQVLVLPICESNSYLKKSSILEKRLTVEKLVNPITKEKIAPPVQKCI